MGPPSPHAGMPIGSTMRPGYRGPVDRPIAMLVAAALGHARTQITDGSRPFLEAEQYFLLPSDNIAQNGVRCLPSGTILEFYFRFSRAIQGNRQRGYI
jgi:hypothetical protein